MIKSYVNKNKKNSIFIHNLGQNLFHYILKRVDCIIGNSSSGIIEAPSLNTPSINLGKRQLGRIMCRSVININENQNEIDYAIKKIYKKNFLESLKNQKKYYQKKNTSKKIIYELEKFDTTSTSLKKFYDINL